MKSPLIGSAAGRPARRRRAGLLIGSLIDFRAGRHGRGDLLFENNCSISGFIQAPAGYLTHCDCPIRIWPTLDSDPWEWSQRAPQSSYRPRKRLAAAG